MIKKFTEQDMQNYADYVAKAVLSNIQPDLAHWYAEWHKTAKKVIDLSVLIDSQIDCEFKDKGAKNWHVSKACKGLYQESLYGTESGDFFEQCQPRMNHIHAWQGGECPLPEGFIVRLTKWSVHVPHISHIELTTKQWISSKANEHTTIQAFEVLGVADGYVMPWEQDK